MSNPLINEILLAHLDNLHPLFFDMASVEFFFIKPMNYYLKSYWVWTAHLKRLQTFMLSCVFGKVHKKLCSFDMVSLTF